MAGEIHLRNELNKLMAMPYFFVRFICLGLTLALSEAARVFVSTSALKWIIPFLVLSGALFLLFEALTLIKIKPKIRFSATPALLWVIFCVLALISEIVNKSFPYNSLLVFALLLLFTLMGQEDGFFNLLLFSCGIPIFADICLGFVFHPLTNNNYALSVASLTPVILCALAWILLNTGKFYLKLFVFFMLVTAELIYLTAVSGGRTGFLTIIATIFFFVIALIIKFYSGRKSILYKNENINLTIISAVALLIALTIAGAIVLDNLVTPPATIKSIENLSMWEKFKVSISNGNPLSNRGMIWKYTIKNIRLFGNGADFYKNAEILTPDQCTAHNTYLAVLGHYGLLAFIAFTVFCMYMLLLSVKYCLAHRRLYIFPFTVLISYFVAGITEDLIYMFAPRVFELLFLAACAYLLIADASHSRLPYTKSKI